MSTTAGLASWLVDTIDGELTVGSTGTVVDSGIRRTIRIDEMHDLAALEFTWWRDDRPGDASTVRIDLEGAPDGSTRVRILERSLEPGDARAALTSEMHATRQHEWEVRVLSLWACTVAMALVQ